MNVGARHRVLRSFSEEGCLALFYYVVKMCFVRIKSLKQY